MDEIEWKFWLAGKKSSTREVRRTNFTFVILNRFVLFDRSRPCSITSPSKKNEKQAIKRSINKNGKQGENGKIGFEEVVLVENWDFFGTRCMRRLVAFSAANFGILEIFVAGGKLLQKDKERSASN